MAIFVIVADDTLAKQHLAKLLKELRDSATQRQFAQRLGTSYTSIQDWEKQIRLPSDKNLKRIAQLKASFINHNPLQALEEKEVDPALFTDIFLRNDLNRQVSAQDLKALSELCYRLIRWKKEELPEIDPNYTYANQTELLLRDLSQDC